MKGSRKKDTHTRPHVPFPGTAQQKRRITHQNHSKPLKNWPEKQGKEGEIGDASLARHDPARQCDDPAWKYLLSASLYICVVYGHSPHSLAPHITTLSSVVSLCPAAWPQRLWCAGRHVLSKRFDLPTSPPPPFLVIDSLHLTCVGY